MPVQPIPIPTNPEQEPKAVEDIFSEAVPTPEQKEQRVEAAREQAPETRPEFARKVSPEGEQQRRQYAPPPAQPAEPTVVEPKSEEEKRVELILSEHLDEIFLQMDPAQQAAFQKKGEETANAITTLLRDVKVKVKGILDLIREWLKMIPGVNKFFIEQEAKIKTDRILALHEQKHKQ